MSITTSAGGTRRAELGAFLRSRRERITPEDVGLPPGIRRRTAGLRREEVAMLAGVGVTWYTWLEQGRPINASTQVLDAVARTLKLDQPEREHLYRLADVPDAAAAAADGLAQAGQVAPEMQGILDGLTTLPASIMNERFATLVEPRLRPVPGVVRRPACERNSLWLSFTYAPCCNPTGTATSSSACRRAAPRRLRPPRRREAAPDPSCARLQAASPEFGTWAQHEVASRPRT
jgi:transcriptional regulator with XRE-family HTH domain